MFPIILSIIVFFAIALFVYGISLILIPSELRDRLKLITSKGFSYENERNDKLTEAATTIAQPFAHLSLPEGDWENSDLRKRFMHAGYRLQSMPVYFFAAKTLLVIIPSMLLIIIASGGWIEIQSDRLFIYCTFLACFGYIAPSLVLDHKIKVRQRELFENIPDAIDLMRVCVEAGLGMDAAIVKVSEEIKFKSIVLAEELYLVNLELRAGRSREEALHNLSLRTGLEEIETLVAMLIQTDRFGTSIADALRVHSDMLRTKRRLRAEEAAAKIALKLLFPLIFFIFPSIFVVALGPAGIQIYRVLLPTFGGN